MKIKALFSIILAMFLLFSIGCKDTEKPDSDITSSLPSSEEKELKLQILYCSNDTLNPFNTKNKSNMELSRLLYDSLVSLSNDFEPIYLLAESIKNEENVCTVKLKNATFSNNTPVTSEDVIASYLLAKESNLYKNLFYNVKSVTALDITTVIFELGKRDPYFENLLTFPIIKKGSDQLRDEDNVEIEPIGSGRYLFSHNDKCLVKNPYYKGVVKADKINLVDAPDSESVEHYVEIGATDFYYTDPENNIVRISGKNSLLIAEKEL